MSVSDSETSETIEQIETNASLHDNVVNANRPFANFNNGEVPQRGASNNGSQFMEAMSASFQPPQPKVNIPIQKYDGRMGPIQFKTFLLQLTQFKAANNYDDNVMLPLAIGYLEPRSPAWMAYSSTVMVDPQAVSTYDQLLDLLRERYHTPLTLDQMHAEEQQMRMKSEESLSEFYSRCEYFHVSKDAFLTQRQRSGDGYRKQLDDRIRDTFVKGVPNHFKLRLGDLDVYNTKSIEILKKMVRVKNSTDTSGTANQANGYSQQSSNKGRNQRRGRGRGGQNNNRGSQNNANTANRDLLECHKCKRMAKHRANECNATHDKFGQPIVQQQRRQQQSQPRRQINETSTAQEECHCRAAASNQGCQVGQQF